MASVIIKLDLIFENQNQNERKGGGDFKLFFITIIVFLNFSLKTKATRKTLQKIRERQFRLIKKAFISFKFYSEGRKYREFTSN